MQISLPLSREARRWTDVCPAVRRTIRHLLDLVGTRVAVGAAEQVTTVQAAQEEKEVPEEGLAAVVWLVEQLEG